MAAFYAYGAYKIESGRDKQAALRERGSQASQVAVWTKTLNEPNGYTPLGTELFVLRNSSELPVYEVIVFSYKRAGEVDEWFPDSRFEWGLLPPTDAPVSYPGHTQRIVGRLTRVHPEPGACGV
jgi:hypothetical protein